MVIKKLIREGVINKIIERFHINFLCYDISEHIIRINMLNINKIFLYIVHRK